MDPSQDKLLQRLYQQKASLENARVMAPMEERTRLRQRIEDLDREIAERLQTLASMTDLNLGISERQERAGDRVRVLVVTANPLGSTPLQLDREVKIIDEALRRSRKRDNFVVEYRLAATPSELRRALLDVEPHVLHFSGHGAGNQGLLFVSDESAASLYRSAEGEVRAQQTSTNEIRFVPAEPLARLLGLCDEHLECVVLNACYSDIQGNAIAAHIPITIGSRDQIADRVAIKFAQGFYDAIGAGKSYEKAFEWGKVAIEFDLANQEAAKILVLRKKGEPTPNRSQEGNLITVSPSQEGNRVGQVRSLDLGNGVSLPLVYIPAGTFWMGQTAAETQQLKKEVGEKDYKQYFAWELPRHRVTVPPFWMARTPITQAQWSAVMGNNPATGYDKKFVSPHQPVVGVSWDRAVEFCEPLTKLFKDDIFRLPTEAEWEYACRAGTETAFYFGDSITTDQANFDGNFTYNGSPKGQYRAVTTPVGQFPANAWGLQDMHGNVWEWCADQWYDSYEQKPQDLKDNGSIAWTKENTSISPSIDTTRLLRGGSWNNDPWICRAAQRLRNSHNSAYNSVGVRVVCVARTS